MDLIKETLEKAKKDGIKFVMLQFTDLHGVLKSVTIPAHKLPESLEPSTKEERRLAPEPSSLLSITS